MQSDDEIRKLTDYQHVRTRPMMYLGSTTLHNQEILIYDNNVPILREVSWVPAIYTAYREILDNALDEINHGYGNKIEINFDADTGIFSVEDNGRGIPIDWNQNENMHIATMVMAHTRAGRNFGDRGEWAGTNGIGASAVNFCSTWFELEVKRNKKIFHQRFEEGFDEHIIHRPKITPTSSIKTGTKVTFKLSDKVFKDKTIPEDFLYSRVFEIALCNPNVKITWNGKKLDTKITVEKTLFETFNNKPIIFNISTEQFSSDFYLLPDFCNEEFIHSTVNNIPTFNGGIHIDNFKRYFYSSLLEALESTSKRRKLEPNRNDINKGLLIYNITKMNAPDFDSQSKTRLINEHVGKIIKDYFSDSEFLKNVIKKHSLWIDSIYDRCAQRTQKRDDSTNKKKAKNILRGKVPDLTDATSRDRRKCILFLGEGDSAVSGITPVRNPEIHGILALSGKILNVNGENVKKVLDAKSLGMIMNSVGLQIGTEADRFKLNYGKIYIAHDQDPDGLNIGALLINFFFTYWPELFEKDKEPCIYIFMTPYVIARKGKDTKYWYAHNYHEFDSKKYKGWDITRAKGLASLLEEDWIFSLENPQLYPVLNDDKLKEALDLIFNGNRSDDRKEWIGL